MRHQNKTVVTEIELCEICGGKGYYENLGDEEYKTCLKCMGAGRLEHKTTHEYFQIQKRTQHNATQRKWD